MFSQNEAIDRYAVMFQLDEALELLRSTATIAKSGEYRDDTDEWSFAIYLAHILDHLRLSWHRRRMSLDEVMQESQEEFEQRAVSVPNWGCRFQLVEPNLSHETIDTRSRQKINQNSICTCLHAAEATLQALISKVESGQFDSCDIMLFGNEFVPVLCDLCLAWHLRYLSDTEISSLDPSTLNEIGSWLPKWQWNLRLIPLEEDGLEQRESS